MQQRPNSGDVAETHEPTNEFETDILYHEVPLEMIAYDQWLCVDRSYTNGEPIVGYYLPDGTNVNPSDGRFASFNACYESSSCPNKDEFAFVFTEADPFVGIILADSIIEIGDGIEWIRIHRM